MNIHQLKQYIFNNLWYGEAGPKPQPVTPELIASVLAPPTDKVWGCDFSHWNIPPVDIPRMVEMFGMSFVIIKGCDGSVYSKYYFDHVEKAKEAGIPWGMYVWLYPGSKVSIDAQVNAWLLRYNVDKPPLGLYIDAEWTYYGGQPANPTAADLRLAHDKWKARSGTPATTYTAKGYADVYLSGFDWNREELWIANYGVSSPAMPNGATEWTFWQYTNILDGLMLDPNGNKSLDGNYFNGTAAEFAAKYLGGTPPTNGGTMQQWKIIWAEGARLRTGPAITYGAAPLADNILDFGQVVNVVDYKINVAGVDEWAKHENGYWFAAVYNSQPRAENVTPDPEIVVNAVLKADGTVTGTWTEK